MIKKYLPEELIRKYTQKICSEEEQAVVESWHIKDLSESKYLPSKEDISQVNTRMASKLFIHIETRNKTLKKVRLWQQIALTASVLLVISIITFVYPDRISPFKQIITEKSGFSDIRPGSYKAILTLSDGKKIKLDEKVQEISISQSTVNISQKTEGKLVYENLAGATGIGSPNTLETPQGGHYQLILPDGTKVWLNSATKLTYPTVFSGIERRIKLVGEAFFEVTKDRSKPFRVQTDHQVVEVLGTHFNVSAYPEEHRTQTTLIEGKVKIKNHKFSKTMKPGQEAFTEADENDITISTADIEKNIAWKNNEFIFNGENLQSIMRSIARWYDVDIIYQNYSNQARYWGAISRSKNISTVLKMLESTGKIKFKIEGRRIIAMN